MSGPLLIAAACAFLSAGCSTPSGNTSGSDVCDATTYPCGPYGVGVGDVIANATLTGRRDDNHDGRITDDPARPIQLSDYHGDPNVKVLALFITTEWCVPCRAEQPELIGIWNRSQSMKSGVAVLELLVQNTRGGAADQTTIDTWANGYGIPFDMAFDPMGNLGRLYTTGTYPSQAVITMRDMRIRWAEHGITSGALQTAIDDALAQ